MTLETTAANDNGSSRTQAKYIAVNGTWPSTLPPLSARTAKKAFKALYRYRFHKPWTDEVEAVKGSRRRTWVHIKPLKGKWHGRRRVMVVAPDAGWHDFIHDLSHWVHGKQYPDQNAHKGSSHAAVERDLIEEVLRRGWLNEVVPVKPKKAKPDVKQVRLQQIQKRIKSWTTKQKRATTALKKLQRQLARYEKLGLN